MLAPDEYLTAEEQASIRHEYVAGAVYAMAGAAILDEHETILVECGEGESRYRAGLCLDDIYEDVRW